MRSLPKATRSNEFNFRLTSQALVALMITCAVFTLLSLIERLQPNWQPNYLPVLCFLTALERLYTYKRFERLALFSREWAIAMFSEWVVILVLVKLVSGLSRGMGPFVFEVSKWQTNFNRYFFSNDFVFALALVAITWVLSGVFAGLLTEMDLTQAMLLEIEPGQEKGKLPARDRLMSLVFSIGTVLVVMTALVRVDRLNFSGHTNVLTFLRIPALAGGGGSTLLYFMLGMALFSQTRFIDLHTRWSVQRIPVSHKLGRGWALYSLGFLGLMAALVALLPTSYSLETLGMLGRGISFIVNMLFFIAQSIVGLLIFLISLPMLLFGRKPETISPEGPALKLPEIESLSQAAANPAWWDAAKTLIFWAVFAAILLFSLAQYLRQHDEILQGLHKISARARLSRLWQWLRSQFKRAQTSIARTLEAGRELLRRAGANAGSPQGGGFFSTRSLDARQKITFFYLALIRRGGEKGLPRRPSQTPYEYASTLDAALPDVEEDIDTLTKAFIEARYSPRPVQPEQVNLVKSTWERLRKAMRAAKQ